MAAVGAQLVHGDVGTILRSSARNHYRLVFTRVGRTLTALIFFYLDDVYVSHSSLALEREENVSILVGIYVVAHRHISHIALYGFSVGIEATDGPSCSGEPCAPRALSVNRIDAVAVCCLVHYAASEYVELVATALVESGEAYLTLVVVVHPYIIFGGCLYGKVAEVLFCRTVHTSGIHSVGLHHLQSLGRYACAGIVGIHETEFRSLRNLIARRLSGSQIVPVMAVLVRSNGLMTTRVVLGLSQVYIHAL